MSDILDSLADTVADWHGSADSMRWKPGPTPEQARAALEHMAATMAPVVRAMTAQFEAISRSLNETLLPMARALGLLPPLPQKRALLDSRYHQRQKNRRKRRR